METHNKVLCNTETEFHCGSKSCLCDSLLPASCVCVCVCVCVVCVYVCVVCVVCLCVCVCVCVVCVCVCVCVCVVCVYVCVVCVYVCVVCVCVYWGWWGREGRGEVVLCPDLLSPQGGEKSPEIRLFRVTVFSLSCAEAVPSPLVILWYPYLS